VLQLTQYRCLCDLRALRCCCELWDPAIEFDFNLAEKERELTIALNEVRYELAKRDREKAFARAPFPSTMMH
jgi:hypothetical protein